MNQNDKVRAAEVTQLRSQIVDACRALGYDDDALELSELAELVRDRLGEIGRLQAQFEILRQHLDAAHGDDCCLQAMEAAEAAAQKS